MSDSPAKHRLFRMRHVLLGAGVALCILMAIVWRPLAIQFHRVGMSWASAEIDSMMNERPRSFVIRWINQRKLWDWYDFHRDGLVGLNALIHRQYRFHHVACPSSEAGWVEKQYFARLAARPGMTDWTSGRGHGSTTYELNIWIPPDDVANWDAWYGSLNRPGLAEAGVAAEAAQAEDSSTPSTSE